MRDSLWAGSYIIIRTSTSWAGLMERMKSIVRDCWATEGFNWIYNNCIVIVTLQLEIRMISISTYRRRRGCWGDRSINVATIVDIQSRFKHVPCTESQTLAEQGSEQRSEWAEWAKIDSGNTTSNILFCEWVDGESDKDRMARKLFFL